MTIRQLKNIKSENMGFSLVELIIVIAIMAVLIAVLAPLFMRYVERSRISTDMSAIGSMTDALKATAIDPGITPIPPSSITLKWDCGNGGDVIVSGDPGYQLAVWEIVGDVVPPRSNAAQAAGASVEITLTLETGMMATAANNIDSTYFEELLLLIH